MQTLMQYKYLFNDLGLSPLVMTPNPHACPYQDFLEPHSTNIDADKYDAHCHPTSTLIDPMDSASSLIIIHGAIDAHRDSLT